MIRLSRRFVFDTAHLHHPLYIGQIEVGEAAVVARGKSKVEERRVGCRTS